MSRARLLRRLYDDYGAPIVEDIAETLSDLFEVKPRPRPRQKPEVKIDNPGGSWLETQRRLSQDRIDRGYGPISGAVTGYVTRNMELDPRKLEVIPGAQGERRVPGEVQYDELRPLIEAEGFRQDRPILVGINHLGDPYIVEGNTRAAVARDLGIDRIPADVRYFAGGESVEGAMMPELLESYMPPSELVSDPNFARWFEGSKAVDQYGEPLLLTHGTLSGQINEFRPYTHFGTPIQANTRIEALQEAKETPPSFLNFAARQLFGSNDAPTNIPVYLSVRNPKRMNDHLGESWEDRIRVARDEGFDSIVYLNRAELSDEAHEAILKEELRLGASLTDDEIRELVSEAADSYIIFDPNQVKSAIGNRGTYDPESADIGMKKGGRAKPVWEKKRPKGLGKPKPLSAKKKKAARARAAAAGRPYPNMVDNLAVARKKKAGGIVRSGPAGLGAMTSREADALRDREMAQLAKLRSRGMGELTDAELRAILRRAQREQAREMEALEALRRGRPGIGVMTERELRVLRNPREPLSREPFRNRSY